MMQIVAGVKDISLFYHSVSCETEAIRNLSFDVEDGEFMSIVGPSGCGKSTLLSILSGLLKPTSGKVYIKEGYKTGYMLQKDHLFEWRTIFSNACLGLEIQKKLNDESKDKVHMLLEKYGLKQCESCHPSQLSGGMRQRAALIRTLATQPDILLLDEPFSALDYQTRLSVSEDISRIIRAEKKTAILVTHDISEAIALSDRVIVLSKRPAVLKSEFKIDIQSDNHRQSPKFREYFDKIWKELEK
ncbi:MAG: ABC transporter ATP-binding protein [Clostridia bacterium]|nr:ABC transporter ATP-binding protein [Clostridia bacterium]